MKDCRRNEKIEIGEVVRYEEKHGVLDAYLLGWFSPRHGRSMTVGVMFTW